MADWPTDSDGRDANNRSCSPPPPPASSPPVEGEWWLTPSFPGESASPAPTQHADGFVPDLRLPLLAQQDERPEFRIGRYSSNEPSTRPPQSSPFSTRGIPVSESTVSLLSLATARSSPPPPWTTDDCESGLRKTQSDRVRLESGVVVSARAPESKLCAQLMRVLSVATLVLVASWLIYEHTAALVARPADDNVPHRYQSLINFQAHSFNDVRQWPSLYRKGARSFKIDPHYVSGNHSSAGGDANWPLRSKLVLTHNAPAQAVRYHELEDVVMALDTSGPLMQLARADKAALVLQLCFKSAPEPCSDEGADWIALVDKWHFALSSISGVEVILDGFGKPFGCLQDKWRPWKSVWMQNDRLSPPEAFWETDDDTVAANSRYAVLNDAEGLAAWKRIRDLGYGRFANEPYPYQVWEPDDQGQVIKYTELFATGPKHSPGYVFVANIDPVMIAAYAGARGASSMPIVHDHKDGCPLGVVIVREAKVTAYMADGHLVYSTSALKAAASVAAPSAVAGVTERQWTRLSPSGVLSDDHGAFAQLRFKYLSSSVVLVSVEREGALIKPSGAARCAGVHRAEPGAFVALWLGDANNETCSTVVDLWVNATQLVKSTCVNARFNDADVAVTPAGRVFLVGADASLNVRAGFVDDALRVIGVGATPRVALEHKLLAVVVGESFCPNSQLHNKRAAPLVCDAPPVPMAQVLTYYVATVDQWTARLARHGGWPLSPCDDEILWGAMDVGQCPVIAVASKPGLTAEQAMVAVVHRAADDKAERTCGVSAWKDSLVAAQFPVVARRQWSVRHGWSDDVRVLEF